MTYSIHVRSLIAGLRDGIPRAALEYSKRYDSLQCGVNPSLTLIQALSYCEVTKMADKAALFKSVLCVIA